MTSIRQAIQAEAKAKRSKTQIEPLSIAENDAGADVLRVTHPDTPFRYFDTPIGNDFEDTDMIGQSYYRTLISIIEAKTANMPVAPDPVGVTTTQFEDMRNMYTERMEEIAICSAVLDAIRNADGTVKEMFEVGAVFCTEGQLVYANSYITRGFATVEKLTEYLDTTEAYTMQFLRKIAQYNLRN